MNNPFAPSTSRPGHGAIVLRHLAAAAPVLQTLSYQYPLKLIAPAPATLSTTTNSTSTEDDSSPTTTTTVHTVFILSYGGGLVAGDTVALSITLDAHARLVLLTQGSTKIFPGAARSAQRMDVTLAPGAALVYLPDPVQPFAGSAFAQAQTYTLLPAAAADNGASLCVCDWVCEGRSARGEVWDFDEYASRNEVYLASSADGASGASAANNKSNAGNEGKAGRRLLLRDNLLLTPHSISGNDTASAGSLRNRMDNLGVIGTLILRGPLFKRLSSFFIDEFGAMPRIGGRKWETDPGSNTNSNSGSSSGSSGGGAAAAGEAKVRASAEVWRTARLAQEAHDNVLWTAAQVRDFVLVKFGAREVEGARLWLGSMLKAEGTVEREFGERALLCLR